MSPLLKPLLVETEDGRAKIPIFPKELRCEQGLGFRVQGLGFRVQGSGFRV